MKRIEPLGKGEKRNPIGLSHSELVNIVWIDPKTGKKRIFKTKTMGSENRKEIKENRNSFFNTPLN